MSSPSSSSSTPKRSWKHDVFLSFRGEDTRNNFVDHLYNALVQKGIHVFKDDKMLPLGKPISTELLQAIEDSRFAVVILSKNYANSSWCLDELVKIMECQDQKVLPVFYHVNPSDVQWQKRDYGKAFLQHEEKFVGVMDKVNNWRKALAATANIPGWHITADSGGESAFIDKIVNEILPSIQPSGMDGNLVGIESRVDALKSLLSLEATHEARMIGISGMGGIGKTTIARTLFRKIVYLFDGSSFVDNVRKNSSTTKGICLLQEIILKDVLVLQQGLTINNPEDGAKMIQLRFRNKRVLLVLDDVDSFEQIEYLAGTRKWFGPGSRIIITTRDEHLLSFADCTYKPALLLMDQAVELFSRHAFRKNSPPDEFKDLSNRAIGFTGRLPLALKVLGSFFRRKNITSMWESDLASLAKTPNLEITKTLRFSFDHLHVLEKRILLDIACFFKGKEVKYVTRLLDSFDFHAVIGIEALIEKCLITISYGKIDMHDLIQEMGQKIACESYPNSRIWKLEEIRDFIKKNEELKVVEAIVESFHDEKLDFSSDIFKPMTNLRLLDVYHHFTSCEPTFLPDELRWLCWFQYPFPSLPLANMHKLTGLKLHYGRTEHLWAGQMVMPNLKFINFYDLSFLKSFPDVSGAPNIERLVLSSCRNLEEVHESLGSHGKLVSLDMSNCWNLRILPSKLEMESLEILILINCHSLEGCPEFSPCMAKLSHIDLFACYGIKELSSSIRHLSNLRFLNLEACKSLAMIPNSIYELRHLRRLCLHDCCGLQKLPEEFGSMDKLEELQLGSGDYFSPFEGQLVETINFHVLTSLSSLRKLDLAWRQIGEEDFPKDLHGLSSLEELNISHNSKLTRLPASISHLSCLQHLELDECSRLQSLHALPSGVQVLKASRCRSLEKIEDLSNAHEHLYMIWLLDCQKLLPNQESRRYLDMMSNKAFLKKWAALDHGLSIAIPGSKIPSWFKEQHGNKIALKLDPKWQSQIMGFAICGVFKQPTDHPYHRIELRYERDAMCDPKLQPGDCTNAPTTYDNENVWIGYIPFSCFVQMHDGKHLQHDDWSSITEGNLIVTVGLSYHKAVRCGAYVVYKDDIESIHQRNPHISYYWNWDFVHQSHNTVLSCEPVKEECIVYD
ncbi:putative TIR domain, P-loop containing nucleoside triphosphate hydrolase [Helianthus annuus]|uniref:ADP-ribosyl cyclase/cyclic ADP-ribose hydrolase n=2 Tax=Helianthus annuus TaxID=4232 RepID=A0A251UXT1_HELAN|nr:putative TIR domain, P-loop containing nucleoside triphosphate hydrolase [Helianthus annuus]KAJ0561656.1 putative TIR domain, P-loop containing nucleoside triphosphate hydrolase [Helianthus annuus]KAJ0574720.1 putative TIR domain, P-loop containing nucleoside triphosphate hydrolase [Helianthus annuus]KAJ0739051.1 putative TIR domain, P-loop containing nucleoside triphosphate hydrolase [Helianthus annuus]